MKKYVSPELNVELFNLVDMIMESGVDFGSQPDQPGNPDQPGGLVIGP